MCSSDLPEQLQVQLVPPLRTRGADARGKSLHYIRELLVKVDDGWPEGEGKGARTRKKDLFIDCEEQFIRFSQIAESLATQSLTRLKDLLGLEDSTARQSVARLPSQVVTLDAFLEYFYAVTLSGLGKADDDGRVLAVAEGVKSLPTLYEGYDFRLDDPDWTLERCFKFLASSRRAVEIRFEEWSKFHFERDSDLDLELEVFSDGDSDQEPETGAKRIKT